jgi:nitrate/nitrite transport system substrate-binding protein
MMFNMTSDPYADRPLQMTCACGVRHARSACAPANGDSVSKATVTVSVESQIEQHLSQVLETSLVKALFPVDSVRRHFLRAVGANTARAAIAAALPAGALSSLQAMAQDRGPLEKKDLKIGFLPITCASPLIMAAPMGLYQKEGLNVQLIKTPGWGVIRDRLLQHELDSTHLLSPMPLAMSLGMGASPMGMHVASIQNNNGNAITLHNKHKDKRNPRQWKGMTLAIPFEHSMHNYLLRYYLAENGINPDRDVKLRVMAPPAMVAALKDQSIDGFIVAEPFNQRAVFDGVGFIHLLTKDIWDGHPCCAFGTSTEFIQKNPNTFAALYRGIMNASIFASQSGAREQIVKAIAPPAYLNQPEELLTQILTGQFPDGLGNNRNVPDRIFFDPTPWQSMAVWMLTQMRRWGYIKADVDYKQIAEKVFMLTDAKKQMVMSGWRAPEGSYRNHRIMGKMFDPNKPDEYLRSFAIHNMT